MDVTINGKLREISANGASSLALLAVLEVLAVNPKLVAVAINGDVIQKESYTATIVHEGDALEIVRMVGGGAHVPVDVGAQPAAPAR